MSDDMLKAAFLGQVEETFCLAHFVFRLDSMSFQYISPAFGQLWEMELGEIRDHPSFLLAAVHPEDKSFLLQHYERMQADRKETRVEFRIFLRNQAIKCVCLCAFDLVLPDREGVYIGGFAEDITERKAYLDKLLKFNAKKDTILEILSHDLAAPFQNIQGLVTVLEAQMREGDADLRQIAGFIGQDAKRGSDMIRDFVDNEFMESSQISLRKDRLDIAGKLEEMIGEYRNRKTLLGRNFTFTALLRPVYIALDEMKFMQVMNNLISNAIKFTPDNGLITVTVADKGSSVLVTVADNGIGIPAALQPMLFDKFTKARRTGIRGERSIGLGMSIIQTIVHLHQGRIWFESRENGGTTFFIDLPKQ